VRLPRESRILLPAALLLLIILSSFTLLSFRHALDILTLEQRELALRMAKDLAGRLSRGEGAELEMSAGRLPPGSRIAVVTPDGGALLEIGTFERRDFLLQGFDGGPASSGPDEATPEHVAALAPTQWQGRAALLRLDLPAFHLARQRSGLRVLTAVVVTVNFAVALLVVHFIRSLLRPFETILARAREVDPGAPAGDDTAYLLSIFERALDALTGADDLTALQRTLGSSLESGLLLVHQDGRVLALNPSGATLLGVPGAAVGESLKDLLAGQPALLEVLDGAITRERSVHRHESVIADREGTRTLGLTVHPLRHPDGAIRAFLVLFVDLTEAQRLANEQRLSRTLAQVGELAAGLAHELRNSLATIKGYLALIERAPGDDAVGDHVAEMRREAEDLQRVLDDFLSFARPGSTRLEPVSLETVARRAAADPALGGAAVRLASRCDKPPTLQGDAQLLERAVRNLLHNAKEAQARAGREAPVEVLVTQRGERLTLEILDCGDGLAEEIRDRIFQPFATTRPEGVGLGLALARRIVDLHGGRLSIEARPGGGTVARLEFSPGAAGTGAESS
jgi:PAS domain S-box-containing protein